MKLLLKKWLVIFFLFFFVLCNSVRAEKYNVYTPTTYKQIQIVQSPKRSNIEGEAIELLVDYSGSMVPWINLARETLIYILPKIPKTSAVALRVFGDVSSNTYSYFDSCIATRLVSYFKKENQSNIIKGLQQAKVGGNTPIEYALRETVNKDLKNIKIVSNDGKSVTQNKKIILVTDGGEGCGGNPCAYIRDLMKMRNDIQIDVIQLGYDNSLNCLTQASGGKFYSVSGSRQKFESALEDAFDVPKGTVESGRNNASIQNNQQTEQRGYKFIKF